MSIVALAGSPSENSRSTALLRHVLDRFPESEPRYKAAYSGLLKTFLDLLPQDALRGKTVLALGTGGSAAHLLALAYALKPVLAALGARHILDTVYATDSQFTPHALHGHVAHDDVTARIERALADGPLALRLATPLTLVA